MKEKKIKGENDTYLRMFSFIALILLIISIIFPLLINIIFKDWVKSGTFGDTYGALNAIFSGLALAGVIVTILIQRAELKNQRIELSLQRNEMKETRNEFLLNRTTTLVYSQLDRFEKALSNLIILGEDGEIHKGNDAIFFLDSKKFYYTKTFDKSDGEYDEEMKMAIVKLLKIYNLNKPSLDKFAHDAYNTVEVLKRLIYKTNLDIKLLNDLKNLFFVNIGFINMEAINQFTEVSELQCEIFDAQDYINYNISSGNTIYANIFLKSINDFYNLHLTEENFEENKARWLENLGSLEK